MKEEILKLRKEGKTYNQIQKILGCSKSTISYHCSEGQKEKAKNRVRKRRENKIVENTDRFKYRNKKESVRKFQKWDYLDNKRSVNKEIEENFTWNDVLEFYTENTKCYLSGVDLNLYSDDYSFDHIIPFSKGGDNSFDNLGIAHRVVNQMKSDLSVEEFLGWCKIILEYNGYNCIRD